MKCEPKPRRTNLCSVIHNFFFSPCVLCACVQKLEQEGRHRKGCFLYSLYDSLNEKRVYELCLLEEGRAISVVGDRVVKTLGVARARDCHHILPQENEETSASIYIYIYIYCNV